MRELLKNKLKKPSMPGMPKMTKPTMPKTSSFGEWFSGLFVGKSKKPIEEIDLEFMSDTSAAMMQGVPIKFHMILWFSALFLFVAVIWADFAVLDVVTSGEGKVIPAGKIQSVQNLEGGIIKAINVREGDSVEKDETLMVIDDTRFSSSLKENEVQLYALEAKIARLMAEANGNELEFSDTLKKRYPNFVANETRLYQDRKLELIKRLEILEDQVEQKRQELLEMQGRRDQTKRSLELVERELDLTRPLVKDGAVSEVELLRLERTVNDLRGELDSINTSIPRLDSALKQSEKKLEELNLTFKSEARAELNAARAEYERLKETLKAAEDRVDRTLVRSPVKGIVNSIKVNTIGAVIQPGEELMEIVPAEDTLLVEAYIKPQDIGFLRPGLDAKVKISAYDFSIYGGLEAYVEHISADTMTNERGESFYTIRVRTKDKNFLTDNKTGEKLEMWPGMSATVDVLTGQKTVLEYLLKPILKAKKSALRER